MKNPLSVEEIRQISLLRHKILRDLQDFFLERNYLPVETPLLSPDLIPESAIEFFATDQIGLSSKKRELYLVPSPEIWMKRLLASGCGSLFQISRCFRNSEQSGKRHNPEFSMLEWYGLSHNYQDNIGITTELLFWLGNKEYCSNKEIFKASPLILTVNEAFIRWAGFSLEENIKQKDLYSKAKRLGLPVDLDDSRESLFNHILVSFIEPELPPDRLCFLKDYPAFVRTLSRKIPSTPWCERWELYIGETELANCFTEETRQQPMEAYFEMEKREKKLITHQSDNSFCNIFPADFPPLSGVAMGVDRLIMKLLNKEDIRGVLLFPLL